MSRIPTGATALLAIAIAIAGCGRGPDTQFFTLSAVRPNTSASAFAGSAVQVRAVHIPGVLDRPERVIQRSGQQLEIHEFQQWGAPLSEMLQQVLSEDLAARLPPGMVLAAHAPADTDTRGLVIDIQQFAPESDGRVVLEASWVLVAGQPAHPGARGQRRFEASAGSDANAQVAAMSELLGRLADAIAAALKSAAA